MKRILGSLGGLVAVVAYIGLAGVPAFGDEEGTVSTTVTAQVPPPCITVSQSTFDYGPLPFRPLGAGSAVTAETPEFTLTNCGSRTSDIYARSSDFTALSGKTWTLREGAGCTAAAPVLNQAQHQILTGTQQFTLQNTERRVVTSLASGAGQTASLMLWMPCEGSVGLGEQFSADVTFTAIEVVP